MKILFISAVVCFAAATLFCSVSHAQETGSVSSVMLSVEDQSGAIIANAEVKALAIDTGKTLRTKTDGVGKLSLGLPPGSYDLSVECPGFERAVKRIHVEPSIHQQVVFVLEVGSCTQCLPVTAIEVPVESPPVPASLSPYGCEPPDLPPTAAVYGDASNLAAQLNTSGVLVICTLESTMKRIFEGQMGAALYRTNEGSFEAVFLPKTESFTDLKIVTRRKKGRYRYTFRGTPHSSVHYIDSRTPYYFVKRENVLFCVLGNAEFAATLQSKLIQ